MMVQGEAKATPGFWLERRRKHLQQLAGTAGKSPADPVINSMGSTGPPFVEPPQRICDWLRCDGAQVTRPSIDPYREIIDTSVYLAHGDLRLAMPLFFGRLPPETPGDLLRTFAQAAHSMGILLDTGPWLPEEVGKYRERLLVEALPPEADGTSPGMAGITIPAWNASLGDLLARIQGVRMAVGRRPVFLRLPTEEETLPTAAVWAAQVADGIILDEDAPARNPLPLEVAVAETDRRLKTTEAGGAPFRWGVDLLVEGSHVRGADDVVKLLCLGADAVGLSEAALIALDWDGGRAHWPRAADAREKLENLLLGLQREVKLLVGAAGVSAIFTSLPGSRELLRAVDLDPAVRRRLQVKPAGVG